MPIRSKLDTFQIKTSQGNPHPLSIRNQYGRNARKKRNLRELYLRKVHRTRLSLKHYSPGWYLFPHVWLLSQHFHDFSTQGIEAITFGTDIVFLPLKKSLNPVTACIGAHYITKGSVTSWYDLTYCHHFSFSCNISNMRCSVSSPDETPRRELKIRRAAEYF